MADKTQYLAELARRVVDIPPIPQEEEFVFSPETLTRYLKARDWNVDEAEQALRSTAEWRRKTRPLHMDCHWCHDRPGTHGLRQVGFDESGRPVVYSCFAQAAVRKNGVEECVAHVVYLIENAKLSMPAGVHNWVFILDCTGMTLPAASPKLGYGVTQVLSQHYPERLGTCICINHSSIFQGVWKAIKVFVHPNTASKVHLIRSKKKVAETFKKMFPEELAIWLLEEIKLNKQTPIPAGQREFWRKPSKEGEHDPRGCPSYVRDYVENYVRNKSSRSGRTHRPHPNIVDQLTGALKSLKPVTPEPGPRGSDAARASPGASNGNLSDDEENTHEEDIVIPEEFQIPKDAKAII